MIEIKVNSVFKHSLPIAILDHDNRIRLNVDESMVHYNSVSSYLRWTDKDKKHLKTLIWWIK